MKKKLSIIFFVLFAVSLIFTTIFFVPKYGEQRDGNIKVKATTGYYQIWMTTVEVNSDQSDGLPIVVINSDGSTSVTSAIPVHSLNLMIDYPQWRKIIFLNCLMFLILTAILYIAFVVKRKDVVKAKDVVKKLFKELKSTVINKNTLVIICILLVSAIILLSAALISAGIKQQTAAIVEQNKLNRYSYATNAAGVILTIDRQTGTVYDRNGKELYKLTYPK